MHKISISPRLMSFHEIVGRILPWKSNMTLCPRTLQLSGEIQDGSLTHSWESDAKVPDQKWE